MLAAVASAARLDRYNEERKARGGMPIDTGFGVHVGKTRLGIVGEVRRRQGEVFSDAINVAARIEALTKRYGSRLIISAEVHSRIAGESVHSMRWLDRVQIRGRSGLTDVYEVLDCVPDRALREATRAEFEAGVRDFLGGDAVGAARRFGEILRQNPDDRAARYHLHETERRRAETGT